MFAVALTREDARPIEAHPSAILAIVHSLRRTTEALIVWGLERRWESEWNNECLDVHDVVGAQVFAAMNAKELFLEGLSRRVHFLTAASILDGQRALLYDCENTTGVIMPGEDLPGHYGELPRRDDSRTADQF